MITDNNKAKYSIILITLLIGDLTFFLLLFFFFFFLLVSSSFFFCVLCKDGMQQWYLYHPLQSDDAKTNANIHTICQVLSKIAKSSELQTKTTQVTLPVYADANINTFD